MVERIVIVAMLLIACIPHALDRIEDLTRVTAGALLLGVHTALLALPPLSAGTSLAMLNTVMKLCPARLLDCSEAGFVQILAASPSREPQIAAVIVAGAAGRQVLVSLDFSLILSARFTNAMVERIVIVAMLLIACIPHALDRIEDLTRVTAGALLLGVHTAYLSLPPLSAGTSLAMLNTVMKLCPARLLACSEAGFVQILAASPS